jgi:hypothetical protein
MQCGLEKSEPFDPTSQEQYWGAQKPQQHSEQKEIGQQIEQDTRRERKNIARFSG